MKKSTAKNVTQKKAGSTKSQTDWKRVVAMKDEDISFSDNPEVTPEMLSRGVVRRNLKVVPSKKEFPILLDSDMFWWYQKQGPGYQTQINSILRAYIEEQLRK
jgi:uncharacterized protein (DUF4415 family)